jgi:hypothetical protein
MVRDGDGVTRAKAKAKAAALTAAGVPTVVRKRSNRGGYQTVSVAVERTARAKYKATAKGKAHSFRNNASRRGGVHLNVTAEDLVALRASQKNLCPFTDKPLNTIRTAVDHAWDDAASGAGSLRGEIYRPINAVLGRTDPDLFRFEERLVAYAGKRRMVLTIRMCARPPRKRKVSKKALARVRAALRKTA